MVRQIKAMGGAALGFAAATGRTVIGVGTSIFRFLQLVWYLAFLLFGALLVHDLFQIPVSVNSPHKYAAEERLWQKMSPEEEARLHEFQNHCRHVYKHNGHFTYYCPICRKKLIEGAVPLTGY